MNDLIKEQLKSLISNCSNCGNPFVKVVPHQRFCSRRCANAQMMRNYRKANPLISKEYMVKYRSKKDVRNRLNAQARARYKKNPQIQMKKNKAYLLKKSLI